MAMTHRMSMESLAATRQGHPSQAGVHLGVPGRLAYSGPSAPGTRATAGDVPEHTGHFRQQILIRVTIWNLPS